MAATRTSDRPFPSTRRRARIRRLLPLILGIGLVSAGVLPAAAAPLPAAAMPSAPTANGAAAGAVRTIAGPAGSDYATNVFADPWDYSNTDDLILNFSGTQKTASLVMQNGVVRTRLTGNSAYLSPIWPGYSKSLLTGRDGARPANAVDTGKYNAITFEAYSNAVRGSNFYVVWFNCPGVSPAGSCSGRSGTVSLLPGWNTYVVPLGRTAGSPASFPLNWSGRVNGLRLVFNAGVSDFQIDQARLFQRNSGLRLTVPGVATSDLVWDRDNSDSNNVQASGWATSGTSTPTWGILRRDATARGAVVSGPVADLSFLPPGTYRLGVQAREGAGITWTDAVTLDMPQPQLLVPNPIGATDYATAVRRDPWDMNSSTDLASLVNARASFGGGVMNGVNAGPAYNDPRVTLREAAGGVVGATYHLLTVTTAFTGSYDLSDSPGGGSMARLIWERADHPTSSQAVTSRDIVTYPGTRAITIDLSRPGNELIAGFGRNPSWLFPSSAPMVSLRWDPNEDPANGSNGAPARQWKILDVQLRSDYGSDGYFPVAWVDRNYQPGGVAVIRAGTTQNSCSGAVVASGVEVVPGINKTIWNTSSLPSGKYWLCVQITRHGATGANTALGVVAVSHRANRPAAPGAPIAAPSAVRNGGRVDIAFGAGRGQVSGYELQDGANGGWTVLSATVRTTYIKCPTPTNRVQVRVRAFGLGGVSGWSPLSRAVGC